MRKISLDLDALEVKTFEAETTAQAMMRGGILSHADDVSINCSYVNSCVGMVDPPLTTHTFPSYPGVSGGSNAWQSFNNQTCAGYCPDRDHPTADIYCAPTGAMTKPA